jgi:hypothetical protein
MRRAFIVLGLTVLLASCAQPDRDGEHVRTLAGEARMLLAEYPTDAEIPSKRWPPSIARLKPERVSVAGDGLYVIVEHAFVDEWGYYVLRDPDDTMPEQAGDQTYERLGPGIYWWTDAG